MSTYAHIGIKLEDIEDDQFVKKANEFAVAVMDAHVRREMRMIMETTDETKVYEAAEIILSHYTASGA